jgi:heme-degrading monooxygenase HmoA
MTMRISPDSDLLTVVLEFDIEAEEQQPLRAGVERLIREVLSRQPGFVAAHLHVSRDHRKVLNYLQWESLQAFERFCGDEREQRRMRPIIGPYGPRQRVYDVVFAAGRNAHHTRKGAGTDA